MAQKVRNLGTSTVKALVTQFNALRVAIALHLTTYPHADTTSVSVSTDPDNPTSAPFVPSSVAAPASLAGVITLGLECQKEWNVHVADVLAHKAADGTNNYTASLVATASQGAVNTWLNNFKTKINAHLALSASHYTVDSTNTIVAANATDLASSKTLIAAIAAALLAHIEFALPGLSLDVGPA